MNFDAYQKEAKVTDQNQIDEEPSSKREPEHFEVIPLLGLVGEMGALLSEYKKLLRDGEIHRNFRDEVAEELGDVLWYLANVADKFDLSLEEVAKANLVKVRRRWLSPANDVRFYDDSLPEKQQLPRSFEFRFEQEEVHGTTTVRLMDTASEKTTGDSLRDNSYEDDGYRFHDVMHLAFAVYLGWSPVLRKLLRKQGRIIHRTPENVDDAEDGGRAQVVEEAIVAAAYVYAEDHSMLEGVKTIDQELLCHIQRMTRNLEVGDRSAWEWNRALVDGLTVWRELRRCRGGIVSGDLTNQRLDFKV